MNKKIKCRENAHKQLKLNFNEKFINNKIIYLLIVKYFNRILMN